MSSKEFPFDHTQTSNYLIKGAEILHLIYSWRTACFITRKCYFFFLGTKENVFAGLFYPLFPQASWKIILTLLRLWIKLHKFADFIRQFGSDSNLKHLARLPPLSAVHMVHLAYIVLRSELMTLWAVGPALFDWLLLQLWGRQLQCVEEQGTHSRASWKTNREVGRIKFTA